MPTGAYSFISGGRLVLLGIDEDGPSLASEPDADELGLDPESYHNHEEDDHDRQMPQV